MRRPLSNRSRRAIRVVVVLLAIVLAAAGIFVVWALTPLGPAPEALAALESGDGIDVTLSEDSAIFTPSGEEARTGVILYPGGRVDFRSYAPLAREIASRGYFVAIVRMPLNLAVLDTRAADPIIDQHPEILLWGIGGHSLGGAMAASYAESEPDRVGALCLLAAYPTSSSDLSDNEIVAVSLFGTRDGILSEEPMEESVNLLPAGTPFEAIEGGNHAQFGSYGKQPGDNDALISAEEQQLQAAEAVALLMRPFRLKTLTP